MVLLLDGDLRRNFPDQPYYWRVFRRGEFIFSLPARISFRVPHPNRDWWYRRANRRISPDAEDPYTELDYNDIGARISGLWPLVAWRQLKLNQPLFTFFSRNTQDFAKIGNARDKQAKSREECLLNLSLYLWKSTTPLEYSKLLGIISQKSIVRTDTFFCRVIFHFAVLHRFWQISQHEICYLHLKRFIFAKFSTRKRLKIL